jgi:AcrR family transcriptional regulator
MTAVNPRRDYSSTLRERQAAGTRRAVLAAARELFVKHGYGATTVEQIAARAGVSKPTVFAAVGNKQAVLRAVRDVAIAGDDEPIPVAERPSTLAIQAEPDLHPAVQALAAHLTSVASRYAPLHEVLHGAANSGEEALRQLWRDEEQQRLTGARHWIDVLSAKAALRHDVDASAAVDILWLLMSPDNYYRLVHRRNWTDPQYRQWLSDAINSLLFAEQPPPQ